MRTSDFQPRRIRMPRHALLLAMLLASTAWAAPRPPDAPQANQGMRSGAGFHGDAIDDGIDDAKATAVPWSQLDATQREMLAPLQSQWNQIPPRRQQRMAEHAEHWMQLPPERREQIHQRLAHWAQMTPEQRRDAARGEEAFRAMPEADRQRVLDAYQRFKSLSPEQRKALIQRFRAEHHGEHGHGGHGAEPPPQR